jgi:alkylhydroperoxidase family enzyme
MLRWFLRRRLDKEEKKLGESVDYLRHVVDVSPAAFLRFASILPLANSRKALPRDAWFTAQIVAVQHADCGTCVQITVNLARQSGVSPELLRAIIDGNVDELPSELADVYQFTESVMTASGDEGELRETLRQRYGERGLIELSYAIAVSQIPPLVKRSLGYAKSCSLVPVRV